MRRAPSSAPASAFTGKGESTRKPTTRVGLSNEPPSRRAASWAGPMPESEGQDRSVAFSPDVAPERPRVELREFLCPLG